MTSSEKTAERSHQFSGTGNRPALLILGASVRAAAWSALRAGFRPVCADLFADADLTDRADAVAVDDYPAGLKSYADRLTPTCWMYTGALENCPRLISEISRRHHLLGNPADVLAGVRDPFRVADALRSSGLPFLDVRRSSDTPPADGTWLRKPLQGGGGRQIIIWDAAARSTAHAQTPHFFQRHGSGASLSAVFLADKHRSRLLGVTRQLIGIAEWNAPPFGYCGSIGPVRLREKSLKQLVDAGNTLVRSFHLRGLFGIDFLLDNDRVLLTEVNPRYTASMEVLEMADRLKLVRAHVAACRESAEDDRLPNDRDRRWTSESAPLRSKKRRIVGKAILFSGHTIFAPNLPLSPHSHISEGAEIPQYADLPPVGRIIGCGEPICTVFGTGKTEAACKAELTSRAAGILGTVIRAGLS